MTMPLVTEIIRRLEPVGHDPFIDGLRAARGTEQAGDRGRRRSAQCA